MYSMMLNRQDRLRITAHSAVDDRSIKHVYAGEPHRAATRKRVAEAAEALGLPLPGPSLAEQSAEMESLADGIREEVRRIRPLVPDMDLHDLNLIVERRLRLASWDPRMKFFIRRSPEGHYVF